jgi:NADPH-dependent curcumin reductase CurA
MMAQTKDLELHRGGLCSSCNCHGLADLFDYAHVTAGQTVLIHGAAGNVGAYAVQLAKQAVFM